AVVAHRPPPSFFAVLGVQSGPPYGSTPGSGGALTCPRSRTTWRGTGRGGPGFTPLGKTTPNAPSGRLRFATSAALVLRRRRLLLKQLARLRAQVAARRAHRLSLIGLRRVRVI